MNFLISGCAGARRRCSETCTSWQQKHAQKASAEHLKLPLMEQELLVLPWAWLCFPPARQRGTAASRVQCLNLSLVFDWRKAGSSAQLGAAWESNGELCAVKQRRGKGRFELL